MKAYYDKGQSALIDLGLRAQDVNFECLGSLHRKGVCQKSEFVRQGLS